MKAIEYFKKHGWGEAKGLIAKHEKCYMPDVFDMWSDELQDFVLCTKYASFDMSDLKRIVESYELVSNFGGLKRAKRILKKSYTQFNTMVSVVWNDKPFQCTVQQLERAVSDVEACQ